MEENTYTFSVQTELDLNITEAIKRYNAGVKNSENQLNILLKKKSKLDDNLKSFLKNVQNEKSKIEILINKDIITLAKETKQQ